MQKRVFLLMTTVMAFGLTACSGNKKDVAAKEEVQTAVTAKTEAEVKEMSLQMFQDKIMDYKKNPQKWVFKGDKPAIIDFYATWCGPCKQTAPIVEKMAKKYKGQIDVYKVDVDRQQQLSGMFGISSIPTLLFIPKEGMPQTVVGALDAVELEKAISEILYNINKEKTK